MAQEITTNPSPEAKPIVDAKKDAGVVENHLPGKEDKSSYQKEIRQSASNPLRKDQPRVYAILPVPNYKLTTKGSNTIPDFNKDALYKTADQVKKMTSETGSANVPAANKLEKEKPTLSILAPRSTKTEAINQGNNKLPEGLQKTEK